MYPFSSPEFRVGPEAAEAMCQIVRDYKVPIRGDRVVTIGDLIDKTLKDLISKAMLEDRIVDMWFDG
ncbi:hypothetical protein BGZ74_007295 [Mortierella antarctica]|nr:hypothetical protein BGZ74_007295 [Mortierella antarctica]